MKEYSESLSGKAAEVKETVPIHLKMTPTIKEAAEYSNIGVNKIEGVSKMEIL